MIWDKAEELGRLIGQTAEYKALRRAETTLREDADAQAKVNLIQKLARQMDELVTQGQMPDQATAETYGFHTAAWNIGPAFSLAVSRIAPMLGVRPDKSREPNMAEVLPFVHETEH